VIYVSDRTCSFTRDRAGQLGGSGEYRTGRLRVVYFHIRSSEGGSPPPISIEDRSSDLGEQD
jgi:hypothetical protein